MKPNFTYAHSSPWWKALVFFFSSALLLMNGPDASAQCWEKISAGVNYTMGIRQDGTLWAWGQNTNGQLGVGNAITQTTGAVPVGAANNWASVAAGNGFTLAIRTDGTLWAWGWNNNGQLGLGDNTDRNLPVQVGTGNNWATVAVSISGSHVAAIKTDGTLWTWGLNTNGQLGLGTTTPQNTPVQVGTGSDWAFVAAGGAFTFALKTNGTLWAWGLNSNGQLGIGSTTQQTSPVQAGTDNNWASLSAGTAFAAALKTDGTLWTWGISTNGQLGIGIAGFPNQRTSPVQVAGAWAAADAGSTYVVARKTDGTLWAWGQNSSGQLGIGNTTQQASPVQAGTDLDWAAIAAGLSHTIVLKTNKVLYGSGTNIAGQLATGAPGGNVLSYLPGGVNGYPPYLPVLGGGAATLVLPAACYNTDPKGYYAFVHPVNPSRKLLALHPQGNTGTFTVVYDTSRNTNSIPLLQSNATEASSLMGRLVTATYSGTVGTGVRLRFYYSQADSAITSNALNAWMGTRPGASRKWQWIKYEGDAAAMAANQTTGGFSGTYTVLTPDSSGVENGTRFVEFRNLTSFSTFGAIASATAPVANDPLAQCWKQVSTGGRHTLAVKEDGSLWGWGENGFQGALGLGG